MRGPEPVNIACIAAPTRAGVISRRIGLEIGEHGRRGRHHRAVVDRADQLLGADLRLDGRLALHGGGGGWSGDCSSSRSISAALGGARSASPMIA